MPFTHIFWFKIYQYTVRCTLTHCMKLILYLQLVYSQIWYLVTHETADAGIWNINKLLEEFSICGVIEIGEVLCSAPCIRLFPCTHAPNLILSHFPPEHHPLPFPFSSAPPLLYSVSSLPHHSLLTLHLILAPTPARLRSSDWGIEVPTCLKRTQTIHAQKERCPCPWIERWHASITSWWH